jgi:hypothetical protein
VVVRLIGFFLSRLWGGWGVRAVDQQQVEPAVRASCLAAGAQQACASAASWALPQQGAAGVCCSSGWGVSVVGQQVAVGLVAVGLVVSLTGSSRALFRHLSIQQALPLASMDVNIDVCRI